MYVVGLVDGEFVGGDSGFGWMFELEEIFVVV